MTLLDAMECASVPVLISDDHVLPFHEMLDWSRLVVRVPQRLLRSLPRLLAALPPKRINEMRELAHATFQSHLADAATMATSTLRLLERRLLSVEMPSTAIKTSWSDASVRSTARAVSVIVAMAPTTAAMRAALRLVESRVPRTAIVSVFLLWPSSQRPSNLHTILTTVDTHNITIRLLDWSSDDLDKQLEAFAVQLRRRRSASRDCWLFMDVRSPDNNEFRSPITTSIFIHAFAAWKENADAVLTIGDSPRTHPPPFFAGATFVHPLAFSQAANFTLCSQISQFQDSCSTSLQHECSNINMHLCRSDPN